MNLSDFDYFLPPELIAQEPASPRDRSRLMVLDRKSGKIFHDRFSNFPGHLRPGDTVVLNDTKVRPVRLQGQKESGGKVEVLLVRRRDGDSSNPDPFPSAGEETGEWDCLIQNAGKLRPPAVLLFPEEVRGEVLERTANGFWVLRLRGQKGLEGALSRIGYPPLPPYIRRRGREDLRERDWDRYQTVYARAPGAIAAPTAGLHFTKEVLDNIRLREARISFLTLHVGVGTFLPVKAERVENHRLEAEAFDLSAETAAAVNEARGSGGRVVAVGTTVVRTLEYLSDESGQVKPSNGKTGLFILPGYKFKAVDAMITNFHLPRSTLLMLVCAFAGREEILAAYGEAVKERYRFYSYGDAMLITSGMPLIA
jgi:S-adenosylmethionine:tRNA ribosyltransferase-isomerase